MSTLRCAGAAITDGTRLRGRSLAAVRIAWLGVATVAVLAFAAGLPFRYAALSSPPPLTAANLAALGLEPAFLAAWSLAWEALTAGAFVVVGVAIWWRAPDEPFALLAGLILVVFGAANGSLTPAVGALLGRDPALDALVGALETLAWAGFGLFFYLFPDGRFVPGPTRLLAVAWLAVCALWNFAPGSALSPPRWPAPLFAAVVVGFWASWLLSQVHRYRRVSGATERQQTRLVVVAVAAIVATQSVATIAGTFAAGYDVLADEQPTPAALAFALAQLPLSPILAALPAAIALSIARYRLWDVDGLLSRTIVYGALSAFVVGGYVLVVGGLGTLVSTSGNLLLSLLATGGIAVAFNPLRVRLQALANRLVHGQAGDPYAVLSQLGQRLEATLPTDALLPTIVATLCRSLRLSFAAILVGSVGELEPAASSGSAPDRPLVVPLAFQGRTVGELRVGRRVTDRPFTRAERRLLEDVATQIAAAVHAVRLAADLQRSRERLVTAREEERRRLRRDLHDGLGPKLAGQTLKLEAALDSLDGGPDAARALLAETMAESQTIVAEIRRLVYGLRPPALDQLGLVSAVREQAAQVQATGLQVTVSAPDELPPLPAAVEVAAYRIVSEALTNVVRHARARSVSVSLRLGQGCELEVRDDGRGLPDGVRAGIGLGSIRERAEEIGGSCVIESLPAGGTRVAASLPLHGTAGVADR